MTDVTASVVIYLFPRSLKNIQVGRPPLGPQTGATVYDCLKQSGDSSRISQMWLIDLSHVVFGDVSYTSAASSIFAGLDEVIHLFLRRIGFD